MTQELAKLTYQDALQRVRKETREDSYLLISLEYNKKLILPFKQGLKFLESLEEGYVLEDPYSSPSQVKRIDSDSLNFRVMSGAELLDHKASQLLDVPVKDLKTTVISPF